MDKERLKNNLQLYYQQKESSDIDMIVQTAEEIMKLLNINIEDDSIFLSKIEEEEKICMFYKKHIIITTPINVKRGNIEYQIYPFAFKEISIQQRGSQSDVNILMENNKSILIVLNNESAMNCICEIIKEKNSWKN